MSISFDPTRPIYLQIIEAVKKRAVQGIYKCAGPLPSVREMARQMGVNPNTMSRAYMELEREGFISTRRGEGSFITEDPQRIDSERRQQAMAARARFVEEIRSLALEPGRIDELLEEIKDEVTR
ncbi:MAG: GntR family transcriptional regulator [Chloroflexi bacterium]|nr:GntR family transcriptional regulator [Chloroflexota bacterium]